MKNVILLFVAFILSFGTMNAQNEQLTKGNIFLETNTGFGGPISTAGMGSTGLAFFIRDGAVSYSIGGEVGYMVIDRLAIKLGLGYSGGNDDSGALGIFNYKVGAKYYIIDQIPTEISLSGSSIQDLDESPMFLGLQTGYALFLADNRVSLEPGIRYNISLNSDVFKDFIQFRVGFVVHL